MSKLRVWWLPQIGASEPFYVPVQNAEEGKKVLDILAAYDAFQLQNRIKPDYSNTGGLQLYNSETQEYEDWYFETKDDYYEDLDDYISDLDNAEEFDEFTDKLFEQIDWKKIDQLTKSNF